MNGLFTVFARVVSLSRPQRRASPKVSPSEDRITYKMRYEVSRNVKSLDSGTSCGTAVSTLRYVLGSGGVTPRGGQHVNDVSLRAVVVVVYFLTASETSSSPSVVDRDPKGCF